MHSSSVQYGCSVLVFVRNAFWIIFCICSISCFFFSSLDEDILKTMLDLSFSHMNELTELIYSHSFNYTNIQSRPQFLIKALLPNFQWLKRDIIWFTLLQQKYMQFTQEFLSDDMYTYNYI